MTKPSSFLFSVALPLCLLGCENKQTSVTASEKPRPVFTFGRFERVKGTDILTSSVYPKDDPRDGGILAKIGSGSRYGDGPDTHNIIFLSLKDNSFTQLFPHNDYLISRLNTFPDETHNGNEQKTEFFVYHVVKADTNNDQKLDEDDKTVLAISDVNGTAYTELIDSLGSIYAQERKDPNTITIVYWKDSKRWISNIDVRNKKIIYTAELPEFMKTLN